MRKNYLWYQFFRYGLVKPALRLFYSDYVVSGTEHIPQDKPVIFVANHQNSFIDALHVVCNTRKFLHFLTRAEPFEVPVVSHFLRSLNMMPVYRVRDGFNSIKKTENTFEECYRLLGEGDSVLVFAEANHDLKRRVRPLSKGFTRLAFDAEQRFDWQLDLQVQPVGLNYANHRKAHTPFHIRFGQPIPAGNYRELFLRDERKAAQRLKRETASGLQKVTMHVSNLNHYPLHHLVLDTLEPDRQALINPTVANSRVAIIERNLEKSDLNKAQELIELGEKNQADIHDSLFPFKPQWKDLLLSPLYLFSLLNNALPYQLVRWVTVDYIEDHVFDSSAKFVLGLFGLPIYYLLITVVLGYLEFDPILLAGYFGMSLATAPLFVRAKDLIYQIGQKDGQKRPPKLYNTVQENAEYFLNLRKEWFEEEHIPLNENQ